MLVIGVVISGVFASSCAGESGNDSGDGPAAQSIGQNAVDAMESGSDAGCVTDKRLVETALVAHEALMGYDATTMDDLVQFGVEDELGRWTLQIPDTDSAPTVVPTVGGPCDS